MVVKTAPANIARVKEFFAAQGWTYNEPTPGRLETWCQGIPLVIAEIDLGITFVTECAAAPADAPAEAAAPVEIYAEVLHWSINANQAAYAPTTQAVQGADGTVALRVNFTIPKAWEHSENQFNEYLRTAVTGIALTGRAFLERFNPAGYAQIAER